MHHGSLAATGRNEGRVSMVREFQKHTDNSPSSPIPRNDIGGKQVDSCAALGSASGVSCRMFPVASISVASASSLSLLAISRHLVREYAVDPVNRARNPADSRTGASSDAVFLLASCFLFGSRAYFPSERKARERPSRGGINIARARLLF
jgi:hypothetical protein